MQLSKKKLDAYDLQARAVALQSPDQQTKVAALLIHGKTGAVLGSGFNGFIRNAPDETLPKTRPDKYEFIVHAESNMVCNCARHGVPTDGCFVYCTMSPCVNCTRMLYQSGISVVYFKNKYRDFEDNLNCMDFRLEVSQMHDIYYQLKIIPKGI